MTVSRAETIAIGSLAKRLLGGVAMLGLHGH